MKSSAAKVELSAYDDLFQTDEGREDLKRERIMSIPLSDISDFPDHPYQVRDDEGMMQLVESVKTYGLLQPVLVRPIENGKYEMVSGHRRKRAFDLAGIEVIPARVQGLTRDEAILSMVDSNLQREEILPSEKAKAYKMKMEALNRQGKRTDLTCAPMEHKLTGQKSRDIIAEKSGESREQVRRYVRLNELIPEILTLVDDKRIGLRPAVEISYLPEKEQGWLQEAMEFSDATPSHAQTIKMRKFSKEGKLTQEVIESIMDEEKPNQREKSPFRDERITKLIPHTIPVDKQSEYVIKALEYYNRHRERSQER